MSSGRVGGSSSTGRLGSEQSTRSVWRRIDELPRRGSLVAMLAVRLSSAGLQLAVAASIVAAYGTDNAGRFFANVAAIELAALGARLGLPTVLARRAALNGTAVNNGVNGAGPDRVATGQDPTAPVAAPLATGPPFAVVAVAPLAAWFGVALAAVFERPVGLIALGAAAVSVAQCSGGWLRGHRRPAAGALLHPMPGLSATMLLVTGLVVTPATAGLEVSGGPALIPTAAYVSGATVAALVAVILVVRRGEDRSRLTGADYRAAVLLGGTELTNQAVLLAPTLVLARFASADAALVFGLAVRLIRPLAIARFAVIQTLGPAFAGARHEPLGPDQRRLASTTSGLMTGAGLAYATVAFPLVWTFGDRLLGPSRSTGSVGSFGLAAVDAVGSGPLTDQLMTAWAVLVISAVLNLSTGPTGQLLAMRDLAGLSLRASALALIAAPLALLGGFSPAVTAAVAVAVAESAQALTTGWLVRSRLGWASPVLGGVRT